MAQQQVAPILQAWEEWEGRVVAGRFALGRYIGGGEDRAIYETDFGGVRAAVKMVASCSSESQAQLARWEVASKLDHPHLMRVLETGFWHANDEQDMLFAVTEFGDENLAEVLGDRPLSADEVRGMMSPVLDLMAFLHDRDLVFGCLKPAKIFAVGNQVKLAGDGIRHVSDRRRFGLDEEYAAPECVRQGFSPQSDAWSLGMTLVEVMTKRLPEFNAAGEMESGLPAGMQDRFASIAKECLRKDPAKRASIAEIRTMLERPDAPLQAASPALTETLTEAQTKTATLEERTKPNAETAATTHPPGSAGERPTVRTTSGAKEVMPAEVRAGSLGGHKLVDREAFSSAEEAGTARRYVVIGVAILALIGGWLAMTLAHRSEQPASVTQKVTPQVSSTAANQPVSGGTAVVPNQHGTVLRQVMPEVSKAARNSIHGTVRVGLLAEVNPAGQVIDAKLQGRGVSKYFSRQALEAGRRWVFTAPVVSSKPVTSQWALKFEFRRNGDKASAQMIAPKL